MLIMSKEAQKMIQFAAFHSFLLFFFRIFNYIAIFLPKEEEEEPDNPNVFDNKRRFHFFEYFSEAE